MMEAITYLTRPRRLEAPSGKMSAADFLAMYHGHHAEWLPDGTVEILPEETVTHIQARLDLSELLDVFLDVSGFGHLLNRFPQRIDDMQVIREPDLMVVANTQLEHILPAYFYGAADIAIEIVSPPTIARDYGVKFHDYESAGVGEYWIVDPDRRTFDIHTRGSDNRFTRRAPETNGRVTSGVLDGFAFDAALLWNGEKLTSTRVITLVADMLGLPVDALLR